MYSLLVYCCCGASGRHNQGKKDNKKIHLTIYDRNNMPFPVWRQDLTLPSERGFGQVPGQHRRNDKIIWHHEFLYYHATINLCNTAHLLTFLCGLWYNVVQEEQKKQDRHCYLGQHNFFLNFSALNRREFCLWW